jgi:23S rRNA-/tRNA-specific pseudouridylate synthase
VAGDSKYNTDDCKILNKKLNLKRLFLHAYYLSFFYNQKYEFILDLPNDLKEVLSILEKDDE